MYDNIRQEQALAKQQQQSLSQSQQQPQQRDNDAARTAHARADSVLQRRVRELEGSRMSPHTPPSPLPAAIAAPSPPRRPQTRVPPRRTANKLKQHRQQQQQRSINARLLAALRPGSVASLTTGCRRGWQSLLTSGHTAAQVRIWFLFPHRLSLFANFVFVCVCVSVSLEAGETMRREATEDLEAVLARSRRLAADSPASLHPQLPPTPPQ